MTIGQTNTLADITAYEKAWTETMIEIWEDRLRQLDVVDKGQLIGSLHGSVSQSGGSDILTHRFMEYGLNVDKGTGYGFIKGNGGDLHILDPGYRAEHGLDKPKKRGPGWGGGYTSGNPRKRRPWFNRKYYASVMRLKERMELIYGESFEGMIADVFNM